MLICGIGTGLDAPFLPRAHRYVGIDVTPAMLLRARPRVQELNLELVRADSLHLPFADAAFDYAVLHHCSRESLSFLLRGIVHHTITMSKASATPLSSKNQIMFHTSFPGDHFNTPCAVSYTRPPFAKSARSRPLCL